MTILPKRNKRRHDQRDTEVVHHGISNVSHEISVANQQPISHHHTHHQLPSAVHDGLDTILHHGASNNQPTTSAISHRAEIPSRILSSENNPRQRRSPPTWANTDDCVLHKKAKRAKSKASNSEFDAHKRLKVSAIPQTMPLSVSIPYTASGSSVPRELRPTLLPSSSHKHDITHLSPNSHKLLGGAQETAGPARNSPVRGGPGRVSRQDRDSPVEDSRSSTPDTENYKPADSPGGCNSEDEHVAQENVFSEELEIQFEMALKKELGLNMKQMAMDGSCLFRAVADQVYGDQEMHDVVRRHCIDYMAKNSDHFSAYVTEDFSTYLRRKSQLGCFGNHVEVQALSELYNRPIEVYQYSLTPMNIFHGAACSGETLHPIKLSYHRNTHYNSLVDPKRPTIGIGLGLPGLRAGMSENKLLEEVKEKSLHYQLEKTMLNDKIRETDWELTDEAIQEQVARESYLQFLQDCSKRERRPPACTITGPSCSADQNPEIVNWAEKLSHVTSPAVSPKLIKPGSPKTTKPGSPKSPKHVGKSVSEKSAKQGEATDKPDSFLATAVDFSSGASSSRMSIEHETKTFFDLQPYAVFNYNDNIDENEALSRAISQSQQEYLHSLKK